MTNSPAEEHCMQRNVRHHHGTRAKERLQVVRKLRPPGVPAQCLSWQPKPSPGAPTHASRRICAAAPDSDSQRDATELSFGPHHTSILSNPCGLLSGMSATVRIKRETLK